MRGTPNVRILDVGSFAQGRFVHAKLFIAQTQQVDHVLFGSANCTVAALGHETFSGHNEEACLYRRVPTEMIGGTLNIDQILGESIVVDPSGLPNCSANNDDLQFDELSRRHPGAFESVFDTLLWRPSAGYSSETAKIELLDASESIQPWTLRPVGNSKANEVKFSVSGFSERPVFARVRSDNGGVSALAIISSVDALRSEVREKRSSAAERAAVRLDQETEVGLWLLEVLDDLESAHVADPNFVPRSTRGKEGNETTSQHFSTLDYGRFVAGCRLRSESSSHERNSLAGTELSIARAFMNRVLVLETSDAVEQVVDEEKDFREATDIADEVGNAAEAIEHGGSFNSPYRKANDRHIEEQRVQIAASKRRQNRKQIDDATTKFIRHIRDSATKPVLTSFDVLRLRAMLTVVAAAGLPGNSSARVLQASATSLQVLPATGSEPNWPRLIGKLLFSVFGGTSPAINRLQVEDIHDQIPDDLMECWAYCFWAIHASIQATTNQPIYGHAQLMERVYELTALQPEDALSERIVVVMEKLGERFSERLGIDAQAIMRAHQECVNRPLSR